MAVDWLMSLELHFSSTVYGLLLMVLQAFTAFALLTAVSCFRSPAGQTDGSFYDIGGLMLAQVMLIGYLSFSQIVIIWSGNLPGEIGWVLPRVWGAWKWWGLGLLLVQLFMPFLCLVWGALKRDRRKLGLVASAVVLLSPLHFYWLVLPTFFPDRVVFGWPFPLATLLVTGVWSACLRLREEGADEV